MGKLIPVILIILGLGGGLGAGLMLRPQPDHETTQATETEPPPPPPSRPDASEIDMFEFPNHFMVPLVVEDRITSVVVIQIGLELRADARALVTASAPRLRDRLLQVMFDHANTGGFDGVFTAHDTLGLLRRNLLEAAQHTLGTDVVLGVLITDLLRTGT